MLSKFLNKKVHNIEPMEIKIQIKKNDQNDYTITTVNEFHDT